MLSYFFRPLGAVSVKKTLMAETIHIVFLGTVEAMCLNISHDANGMLQECSQAFRLEVMKLLASSVLDSQHCGAKLAAFYTWVRCACSGCMARSGWCVEQRNRHFFYYFIILIHIKSIFTSLFLSKIMANVSRKRKHEYCYESIPSRFSQGFLQFLIGLKSPESSLVRWRENVDFNVQPIRLIQDFLVCTPSKTPSADMCRDSIQMRPSSSRFTIIHPKGSEREFYTWMTRANLRCSCPFMWRTILEVFMFGTLPRSRAAVMDSSDDATIRLKSSTTQRIPP